jgi:hypothetical protein
MLLVRHNAGLLKKVCMCSARHLWRAQAVGEEALLAVAYGILSGFPRQNITLIGGPRTAPTTPKEIAKARGYRQALSPSRFIRTLKFMHLARLSSQGRRAAWDNQTARANTGKRAHKKQTR